MDLRIERPRIRVVPRAQRGLSALVDRAPQAEAFGQRIREKLRPASTWLYASRRRLATVGVAVITVWLFLHVMFGANGMVVYRQKRADYQNLQPAKSTNCRRKTTITPARSRPSRPIPKPSRKKRASSCTMPAPAKSFT